MRSCAGGSVNVVKIGPWASVWRPSRGKNKLPGWPDENVSQFAKFPSGAEFKYTVKQPELNIVADTSGPLATGGVSSAGRSRDPVCLPPVERRESQEE